jgi:phospholipase/carboxylesterase
MRQMGVPPVQIRAKSAISGVEWEEARSDRVDVRVMRQLLVTGLSIGIVIASVCCRGAPLSTIEHGGEGPPTLVMLHGFGASAEQWVPFTKTIRLPAAGRFIFPQGPQGTGMSFGGRAWWPLDLASNVQPATGLVDLSATQPEGIGEAASLVRALLGRLRAAPDSRIILGGYSQGAMLASQIAFMSDEPLAALVLLSGTTVDEAAWTRNLSRRRGLPVFIAHGRSDPTLPFGIADRLRGKLEAAGLAVTWHPFDGGHEIPAGAVAGLNAFIEALPAAR